MVGLRNSRAGARPSVKLPPRRASAGRGFRARNPSGIAPSMALLRSAGAPASARWVALALVACAVVDSATAAAPEQPTVLRSQELASRFPVPTDAPASSREVARGGDASVNYWQIVEAMPPHLHRTHEE